MSCSLNSRSFKENKPEKSAKEGTRLKNMYVYLFSTHASPTNKISENSPSLQNISCDHQFIRRTGVRCAVVTCWLPGERAETKIGRPFLSHGTTASA